MNEPLNQSLNVAKMVQVDYDPFANAPLARVVPTTEAQREIWLACQLGKDASLAYNESISLHMRGPLVRTALVGALQALVERHEALRTTVSSDGQSLYLAQTLTLDIPWIDVCGLAAQAQEHARADALKRAVETPFDLENGPLARAEVLVLSNELHLLVITAHHIVCDGWSFGVLATELMKLYAQQTGQGGPLPYGAPSFSTYALDQTDIAHVKECEAHTDYWISVYDHSVPVLELPLDRARKPVRGFESLREDLTLDSTLVEAVRKLGAKQGVSQFVTLFGMFSALVARLSGSAEVVVGVPAAGQAVQGITSLVGHCVSLLPMRVTTDLQQNVAALLHAANTCVLDAYDHQHCTYGTLLKKLQIKRDTARLALVSVLFNLDTSIDPSALSVPGLHVELHSNPRHFENFDLFVNASQIAGNIVLECQYNTGLFDATTIQRWLALYRVALQRVVADPTLPLAQVFAPTQQDTQLMAVFNQTQAAWPSETRIEALIARQALLSPDAIAVSAGAQHLSYRDLDARANVLAAHLRTLGAGPGNLIGLACGRNEHMLVGLVGILKSGAGYIPLDPAFPPDRLEFMVADAKLRHVVCDRSVGNTLKLHTAEKVIIDDLGSQGGTLAALGCADDVAYVIYTSGSTGRPKGVLVPHRTVTNLLESVRKEPGMTAQHTVLSVTTLSFDIAVCEVLLPLTVGARIVVADYDQATNGNSLRALVESRKVSFINATPSTWRLLLAAGWRGSPEVTAICTGEPLPPDLGKQLLPLVGNLWNGYGPTETTVWSSFHHVQAIDGPVPIGHPIANTTFHVVDTDMRPLPVGVIGELLIGGSGVSLGYLNRPELNAQRFFSNPMNNTASALCYRTGDLGRWRNDGVLECLGRSDHQVKVRGYRIELGEIEATLLTHGQVARAVVITREDQPGDVRLVAYVVGLPHARIDTAAMQAHLRQTLPDYMIPQHLLQLDVIPLLPNGKMDRNALPKPDLGTILGSNESRMLARTPLEQEVLSAMEQVLNLPGIGVRDDFFALGGHSLLAARLTAILNGQHGVTLVLRTVFEAPTAEMLTRAIKQALLSNAPKRDPIKHVSNQLWAPLTPMQQRIRFVEELHPGRVLYNTPSAHRLTGAMDVVKFNQALHEVVRHQPSLRTSIRQGQDGHEFVQTIATDLELTVPYVDLTAWPEPGREDELMQQMQAIVDTPMNIYRAPLFRSALYKLSPNQHVFLFMPHHIVWDGWSFDLFYQEMSVVYGALIEYRAIPLQPLAITYSDYARWQSHWMQGDEFQAQLLYWKERFFKAPLPVPLPTEKPRRIGMTGEGATEWVRLNKTTTDRLREVARLADSTLNMLTMAVFTAMLTSATAHPSIVIGVPVRGRSQAELEPVMGFFNNLLPVQLGQCSGPDVLDFVRHIKNEMLEVFSHQDIPFERLMLEPEVSARSQRAGFYQALFSFQDARSRMRQWGNLSHKSVLIFQKGATEDLGLWLMDVPDGIEGGFIYNADLYTAATARALHERYVELLEQLASNPYLSLVDLIAVENSPSAKYLSQVFATQSGSGMDGGHGVQKRARTSGEKLTTAQAQVATIWASLLDIAVEDISADDRFFVLGGSSLLAMQLATRIEKQFTKKLALNDLVRDLPLQDFALLVQPLGLQDSLVQIREGRGVPVFFVHDGVGETLLYRNLAMLLDPVHPVYVLQPYSSDNFPILHTRISDMARYHLQMIQRVQPHGSYLLSGLCAGGVIAHEIAIQLQKQGEAIAMLGLMDAADRTVERRFALVTKNRWERLRTAIGANHSLFSSIYTIFRKTKNLVAYVLSSFFKKVSLYFQLRLFRYYLDKGLVPPHFLRSLTVADIYEFACLDQKDRDVLNSDVALFKATRGNQLSEDVPYVELFRDPLFGWRSRVSGTIHCFDIPGGHTTMLQEPHVAVLAEKMQAYINRSTLITHL